MSITCSESARLTRVAGWKEAKLGMEIAGVIEVVGMLADVGVKIDVAVVMFVGVIVAVGVKGVRAMQAMTKGMESKTDKINRSERNMRDSSFWMKELGTLRYQNHNSTKTGKSRVHSLSKQAWTSALRNSGRVGLRY
jgi:hypothetical protein